jgi:hypothetical protein
MHEVKVDGPRAVKDEQRRLAWTEGPPQHGSSIYFGLSNLTIPLPARTMHAWLGLGWTLYILKIGN